MPFREDPFALAPPTPQESGLDVRQPSVPTQAGDFLSGLGQGSLDVIFNALDVLDRPGRAVRHFLAGNYRQAAESFDPFNLITPDTPSESFTGGQLLERAGVGEGSELFLGLTSRDLAGLPVEILLDPLTLFGGSLGRLAARGLRRGDKAVTSLLEGLGGVAGVKGPGTAAGLHLGHAMERGGLAIPAVGAVAGAGAEALAGGDASQIVGAGVLGGVAGGAALGLPLAARGALGLRGSLSPKFAARTLPAADEMLEAARDARIAEGNTAQIIGQRQRALDEAVLESAGRNAARARGLNDQVTGLLETRGAAERLVERESPEAFGRLAEASPVATLGEPSPGLQRGIFGPPVAPLGKAPPGAFQSPVSPSTGPGGFPAEVPFAQAARERVRLSGGPESLADLSKRDLAVIDAQIDAIPAGVRTALLKHLAGDGVSEVDRIVPGTLFSSRLLQDRNIIQEDRVRKLLDRISVDGEPLARQIPHARAIVTELDIYRHLMREVADKAPGSVLEGARDLKTVLRRLELAESGDRALRARGLTGALRELVKAHPELETGASRLLGMEQKSHAALRRGHEVANRFVEDPRFVMPRRLIPEAEAHLWVEAPVGQIRAKGTRELFMDSPPAGTVPSERARQALIAQKGARELAAAQRAGLGGPTPAQVREGLLAAGEPLMVRRELLPVLFGRRGVLGNLTDESMSLLGKTWDRLTNMWRGWQLSIFPSWMLRNLASNVYMNHTANVRNPLAYAAGVRVTKTLSNLRDPAAGARETIRLRGQTYNLRALSAEAFADGAANSGHVTSEIGQQFINRLDDPGVGAKLTAYDPGQNVLSRTGFGWNQNLEDWTRVTHYVDKRAEFDRVLSRRGWEGVRKDLDVVRREGETATAASRRYAQQSMFRTLYDLGDTTAFDEVARRVIPFWRWMRHNIPAQAASLIRAPAQVAFVGKVKMTLDHRNRADVPEALLPEWLQGQLNVAVGREGGRLRMFSMFGWLPLADLQQIDGPAKLVRYLAQSGHPAIRLAIENGFNFSLFFQRQIEEYDGERENFMGFPIAKRTTQLLRSARLVNELQNALMPMLGEVSGEARTLAGVQQLSAGEALARVGGIKVRPVDVPANRQRALRALDREMGRLKGELRRERQRGAKAANVDVLERQLQAARRQRMFLASWTEAARHPALMAQSE